MAASLQVDENYDFSAPRFLNFLNKETKEQIHGSEHWFDTSLNYTPSPFMPKLIVSISVQIDGPCDFGDVEKIQKEQRLQRLVITELKKFPAPMGLSSRWLCMEETNVNGSFGFASDAKPGGSNDVPQEVKSSSTEACLKSDSSFAFLVLDVATTLVAMIK